MTDATEATDPAVAGGAPTAAPHTWRPARFMVIVAHPDDADFGPAATAARWIDAGSVGWLVCCTSGDQGGEDPDLDPLALAATREAEQRAAAAIVGYAGVSFLHQPDGALANDLPLRELLVREIRTFRPDAVLTQDPEVVVYPDGGDQPHRPPGRRHRRGRCGLPRGAQPDGVPVAGRGGPCPASGAPGVPVLDHRTDGLGGCRGHHRPEGRGARRPPQPDQDPAGLAERIAQWAAGDGARSGRPRPRTSGWP